MASADDVAAVQAALDQLSRAGSAAQSVWDGFSAELRQLVQTAFAQQWKQIVTVPKYALAATTVATMVGARMAPAEADVTTVSRALNRLSGVAQKNVQIAWQDVGGNDPNVSMKDLIDRMAVVIGDAHGTVSVLGSDVFQAQAKRLGVAPKIVSPGAPPKEQIEKTVRWARSTQRPVESMKSATDRLVKQAYRDTIQNSALESGAGWARVPSGPVTCAFCLILASRGGVYSSKKSAEFDNAGHKYHALCDCVPVMVRSSKDYPAGYDPETLYGMYSDARGDMKVADLNEITANIRRMFPDEVSDGVAQKEDTGSGVQNRGAGKNVTSRAPGKKQAQKSGMDDPDWIRSQLVLMKDMPDTAWKSDQTSRLESRLKELVAA